MNEGYMDLIDQALAAAGELSVEQLMALPKVKFISGPMTAAVGPNGAKSLHVTASSTIEDLHGDSMTEECVRDMAKQATSGPTGKALTIFLNHRYSVPEDVFGRVYAAQVLTRATDEESGLGIWDMDYDIALAESNPRVGKTYELIKDDQINLGVSIGAFILDFEFKDKDAGFWGGLIINKVLLVETSIVGIPANQRSWVQNGVIAIGKSLGIDEKQIRKVLDGKEAAPVKIKTADVLAATLVEVKEKSFAGESGTITVQRTLTSTPEGGEPTTETITRSVTIHKEGCDNEECDGSCHKDAELTDANSEASAPPATTEAAPDSESSAEETTDDATTEGTAEITAEAALSEAAPDIAKALSAGETPALELVLAALEHAASELSATRVRVGELEKELETATTERKKALADVTFAAEIVEQIAKSPLGRKAQFAGPVRSFTQRFSGIYDEGFLKLMEQE